jgi:cytochrome oxidase Cu insertion factor (SCO1/SenC/PrrC family)
LLTPPKQISEVQPVDAQGKVFEWNKEDSHWSFLVVGHGECDAACQKKMYLVRQIHTALGKDALRLDMTYLNLDARLADETQAMFTRDYNHFIVLQADEAMVLPWFVKDTPSLNIIESANFYVIDPAGWVMMYYTDAHDYKAVMKDMKFLLKNS